MTDFLLKEIVVTVMDYQFVLQADREFNHAELQTLQADLKDFFELKSQTKLRTFFTPEEMMSYMKQALQEFYRAYEILVTISDMKYFINVEPETEELVCKEDSPRCSECQHSSCNVKEEPCASCFIKNNFSPKL